MEVAKLCCFINVSTGPLFGELWKCCGCECCGEQIVAAAVSDNVFLDNIAFLLKMPANRFTRSDIVPCDHRVNHRSK